MALARCHPMTGSSDRAAQLRAESVWPGVNVVLEITVLVADCLCHRQHHRSRVVIELVVTGRYSDRPRVLKKYNGCDSMSQVYGKDQHQQE
jgi:hypothetical protein